VVFCASPGSSTRRVDEIGIGFCPDFGWSRLAIIERIILARQHAQPCPFRIDANPPLIIRGNERHK
jgi:hypothetical protein